MRFSNSCPIVTFVLPFARQGSTYDEEFEDTQLCPLSLENSREVAGLSKYHIALELASYLPYMVRSGPASLQ
ncbi:hypothetical protein BJX66DRAFT_312212 [Aspergillus keveii]|uniref:Uncharacterized protein n=1 Tax=Aspergillus keveii TaxID=714993 RepID=A0ABR4FU39_9EURO